MAKRIPRKSLWFWASSCPKAKKDMVGEKREIGNQANLLMHATHSWFDELDELELEVKEY
jgi:hypothetical protein